MKSTNTIINLNPLMIVNETTEISGALANLMSQKTKNGPYFSMLQFSRFDATCKELNTTVEGKRCLEFGCGPNKPYSTPTILYLLGASQVTAIDIEGIKNEKRVAQRTHALLLAIATDQTVLTAGSRERRNLVYQRLAAFDLKALADGNLRKGLPPEIMHVVGDYLQLDSAHAEFDVCVSFSVFEHIRNIDRVLQHLYDNCSESGFIFADVDYRDHRLYSKRLSAWQYLVDDGDVAPGYINKIRHSAMVKALEKAKFNVRVMEVVSAKVPPDILMSILPMHKSISNNDLSTVAARIVMRKRSHTT